MKLCIGH